MENKKQSNAGSSSDLPRSRGFGAEAKKLWNWAEAILLLLGVALLLGSGAALLDRYLSSRTALESFDGFNGTAAPTEAAAPAHGNFEPVSTEEPDFKDWNESRVQAYKQTAPRGSNAAIALLAIPKIHLVAPVMEGADSLTLNHAVGRIPGTANLGEEGNIGIAGHRDSFFRGLKDIKLGDTVELHTRSGRDIYEVDRTQIVTPSDVSVLRPQSIPSLTLVTCYPFYFVGSAPKRFVVTAYLTQHIPAGQATSNAQAN